MKEIRDPCTRKRVLLLSLSALVTLLLLEGLMQVGAFVAWRANLKSIPEVPVGHDVMLCVGDSWTDGMGASDRTRFSYPARLGAMLTERTDRDWTVVNCGQSGQNSRDVLSRLSSQLEAYKPRLVAVLVGQNDFWSAPDELPESAADVDKTAYRFRWRIPRLVAWGLGAIAPSPAIAAPRAMTGPEWQVYETDNSIPYKGQKVFWPQTDEHKALRVAAQAVQQPERAYELWQRVLESGPNDPTARSKLVVLGTRIGRRDDAVRHLDWLRSEWGAHENYHVGRALIDALRMSTLSEETMEVVPPFLDEYPRDGAAWLALADAQFRLDAHADALESVDRAIERLPRSYVFSRKWKILMRGLHRERDAATCLFDGYVATNDHEWVMGRMRRMIQQGFAQEIRTALDSYSCTEAVRARLEQQAAAVTGEFSASEDDAKAPRVLREHLGRIIGAVRNAGAEPVLLTYPMPAPASPFLRAVANERAVRLVDIEPVYLSRVGPDRLDAHKASCGHCNDAGYAVMTDIIWEGVQDLLR